jgi:hypothetical protein
VTPWLTDREVDDLCDGLSTNAAKARHLRGMGLVVNSKPNGRSLVMRTHAEAVLSGLKQIQQDAATKTDRPRPNRDALILAFGHKRAVA